MLTAKRVLLRELRLSDALSLCRSLSTEDVARFIARPPDTIEGFERFVRWTHEQRNAGRAFCFGVVPHECDEVVGLFQVWQREPEFVTAEWGFALSSSFWGSGVFVDSARLVLDFTFNIIGARRVEGRAALANGRGNGALLKLGAVRDALLRKCFQVGGEYHDHLMWSILDDDWRVRRDCIEADVH